MTSSRLSLALKSGAVVCPEGGRIGVFGARAETDLTALPQSRVHIVQGFRPDHDALAQGGWDVAPEPKGPYAMAVIFLPRAKAEARAAIAAASAATTGPLVIDGQKTDGIESLLKDARRRGEVGQVVTKAHGKLFTVTGGDFSDWAAGPGPVAGGFVTAPGVFSADGPDRGSVLLAEALPKALAGTVVDLGAGWGYLAAEILRRETVTAIDLVEANHAALACARANISDPRASFHWADAAAFTGGPYDAVVSNPPFHTSRAGDPLLGAAFIETARRLLKPSGGLWLVANRHLPYEKTLADAFAEVTEIGRDPGFKIIHAKRPRKLRR
ncbi:MAG: methyltransferase [Alphaproteobacteria bacterium]|nr:methyltransferase [Alphaproteobacteria bacterium]NNF23748.1 class I SAM-dependent methyltransferase [Paracoccaceae bacterium]